MKDFEITLDDVKAFIDTNKADPTVIEYVVSISIDKPLNPELVGAYLKTKEGLDLINPMIDQRVTGAVKTHEETYKPKIKSGIAAEMLRLNPQETSEQRQVRELLQNQKQMQEDWEKDKRNAKIKELAFSNNIDPVFIEGTPFASVEESTLWMQRFNEMFSKKVDKEVNERLATSSYKPSRGKENEEKFDVNKLTDKEIMEMEMAGTLDAAIIA
jgi:hypothetical protein